ncbi:solute carrier family 2, facilitated glucose transporter member 9-like [Denticeps clupeoides]|uniref:solute carrier family 2, facilitated glucose transporter member 9-like n=1 Tax=Denticeps clupeoides TaxID=299321 RepID=UPI0010A4B17B|nr:solute carrier family 2, facilitated glucose transporter member 9-like [Denticeps clupeoides]
MTFPLALLLDCPLLIVTVFIAGIGGSFHYGFHISVLNSPSNYIQELVNQTCEQRYGLVLEPWQLSLIWSFIVSIFCIGGLIGSLSAGHLVGAYGRKRCLIFNNAASITGALLMLLSKPAMSFEMIMIARLLCGFNAGISLTAHTMYVLECSPKKLRGMVGVSVATFVSMGKFFGQLLGISELLGTPDRWPWLLGFSGFTGLLQLVTLPFLPESPRFLLLDRADRLGCQAAARRLWSSKVDHASEMEEMQAEHAALRGVRIHSVKELFLERSVRWQLTAIFVTFTTLQLCGINAVYLYSFEVFTAAGIPSHQLRYAALGTGLCEVSTSVACVLVIESTGRRNLLFRGYMGMAATLALLTLTLYLQGHIFWMPYCSMVLIFLYIFLFSTGPAGVTVSLPGEFFTQSFKSPAFTVGTTINWAGLFIIGMVFPLIVTNLEYFCFLIFFVFCFFSGLFVWYRVPETKNHTVLEITAAFNQMGRKQDPIKEAKLDGVQYNKTTKL